MDVIAALRAIDLFEGVGDEALAPLARSAEEVRLAPGETIPPGFVHVLVAGRLEWRRDVGGEPVLLGAQDAPGYAGAINALTAEPLTIAGAAAVPTTLLRIPAQAFRDLAAREPRLVGRVVRLAGVVSSANEATLRERERLAALGGLAAGLAHELGNPASAAVRVAAELREAVGVLGPLVAPPAPDPAGLAAAARAAALLDELQGAVGRVFTLVRAMGEYTQLDRDPEQEINAAGVRSTLAVLSAALDGVTVRTDVPADLPRVTAPAAELNQVWTQLLLNAAQAAPGGTVTVRARARADAVVVAVADDGPGVPAHLRDRVFEPFFTTKGPTRTIAIEYMHSYGGVTAGGSARIHRADAYGCSYKVVHETSGPQGVITRYCMS